MNNPFIEKPFRVITLCGSLKFEKQFAEIQMYLERKGHVILSVCQGETVRPPSETEKKIIDKVHFKKILLSDCILVLDYDYLGLSGNVFPKYIGESTQNEIEFALINNKEVFYVSEIPAFPVRR